MKIEGIQENGIGREGSLPRPQVPMGRKRRLARGMRLGWWAHCIVMQGATLENWKYLKGWGSRAGFKGWGQGHWHPLPFWEKGGREGGPCARVRGITHLCVGWGWVGMSGQYQPWVRRTSFNIRVNWYLPIQLSTDMRKEKRSMHVFYIFRMQQLYTLTLGFMLNLKLFLISVSDMHQKKKKEKKKRKDSALLPHWLHP